MMHTFLVLPVLFVLLLAASGYLFCIFMVFLAKAINMKALYNTDITDVTDDDSFLIVLKLNHLLILDYY